ncbi:hypothetical protein PRIPAC_97734 [Pristionchus pacificus]|uniref:Uncharacterized protein n=1 Tax=Pristionchus pacificus TaxID=54126 RepID=A0A2A6D0D8_PRIPA|nr:hypothetical protein PRIPAC_97734 [Pristionchus pacificus]|eukprot:PDM83934.1 hypothetical protein PRIPAC_34126 [Pristionchus pacificus]
MRRWRRLSPLTGMPSFYFPHLKYSRGFRWENFYVFVLTPNKPQLVFTNENKRRKLAILRLTLLTVLTNDEDGNGSGEGQSGEGEEEEDKRKIICLAASSTLERYVKEEVEKGEDR